MTRGGSGSTRGRREPCRRRPVAPPEACSWRGRPRCRPTRSGTRRFEQPERLPPNLAGHALLPLRGRLRHVRVRLRRRHECVADVRRRQRPRFPAPFRAGRRGGGSQRPPPLRRRRACRALVGATGEFVSPRRSVEVLLRVVVAVAARHRDDVIVVAPARHRRGWVTALLAGVAGWTLAALLTLGLNDWDWGADGLLIQMLAIGDGGDDGGGGRHRPAAAPGSLASGERAGLVVAPRPVRAVRQRIAVLRRYRELVRLARRTASARSRRPAAGRSGRRRARGAAAPRARRGGRRLRQARSDRGDPRRSGSARDLRRAGRAPEPGRARAGRTDAGGARGGARRRRRRVFAEFDWEPLAAASIGQTYRARLRTGEPVVVKVQRPGIDDVMERDLAALALLAGVAQRRTPFGQGVRSAEMLAQFAASLRAELDFRREAEAMGEMAALLGPGSAVRVPEGLRRAVHPAAARAGALRWLHPRRHRRRSDASGIDRRALGRAAVALHARAGAAHRLLPRRSASRQHLRLRRRHPRPDRLRRRRAPRPGPAGGGDRHARRHRPARRPACCATGSSGWPTCPRRSLPSGWSGRSPADGRSRARQRRRRADRAAGPRVAPCPSFGIRLPADLVVLSRALVTARRHAARAVAGAVAVAAAMEMMTSAERRRSTARRWCRDELLAALPHLRRLPDRIDRILTLTSRGELRLRTRRRRGRPAPPPDVRQPGAARRGRGRLPLRRPRCCSSRPTQGPTVAGSTGLFEMFGYGGLLAGSVLLLRVVAAVAGTGRHDHRRPDSNRCTDGVRPDGGPSSTTGRPATGTTAIPATSFGSSCGAVDRAPARLDVELATSTGGGRHHRPRARHRRVPGRRAGVAAGAGPGRRPARARAVASLLVPAAWRARSRRAGGGGRCRAALFVAADRRLDLAGGLPDAVDSGTWLASPDFPSLPFIAGPPPRRWWASRGCRGRGGGHRPGAGCPGRRGGHRRHPGRARAPAGGGAGVAVGRGAPGAVRGAEPPPGPGRGGECPATAGSTWWT